MSCIENERLLENYYEEFLELGYSKEDAEIMAQQKLEDWSL